MAIKLYGSAGLPTARSLSQTPTAGVITAYGSAGLAPEHIEVTPGATGEGALAGDVLAAIVAYLLSVTDGAKAGDTFAGLLTRYATLAEGAKAGDAFAVDVVYGGLVTEGAKAGDAFAPIETGNAAIAEGATAGDHIAGGFYFDGAITEGARAGGAFVGAGGRTEVRLGDSLPDPSNTRRFAVAGAAPLAEPNRHGVYVKQYWADEWTPAPYFWADELVWSVLPQISTARLWWDYGYLQRQGEMVLAQISKLRSGQRHYVKVAQQTDFGSNLENWYGVLEIDEDQQGGSFYDPHTAWNVVATGEQTWTAFGMESMLELEPVLTSTYTADLVAEHISGRPLVFNRKGEPNRSRVKAFAGSHVFTTDPVLAGHWSTRDMVEYLLAHKTPKADFGVISVPWILVDPEPVLATWDAPELDQRGRSVWSLLSSLISRQRLTGARVTVEEREEAIDLVRLEPFTYVRQPLESEHGGTVPANATQINLSFEWDRTASATLKTTSLRQYDKVVARGRRRRSVFCVSYQDDNLGPGWTVAQEIAYEAGFSGDAGYAALGKKAKQERNEEVRNKESLRDVFRRYVMPAKWNARAGNGEGTVTDSPVFIDGELWGPGFDSVPYFDLDLSILQTIPLFEGVDYSGDKVTLGIVDTSTGTDQERPPMVAWKLPESGRWQNVETLGQLAELERTEVEDNFEFSAAIRVPHDGRAIELAVHGKPQHVLAYADFAPLAPIDEDCGHHDWRDAIITIAVEDDRYAEGSWGGSATDDVERVLVIYAGDQFRHDFLTTHTVVGIADDGTLERGGPGWINDDTDELEDLAKLAHSYYSTNRSVLQVETEHMTSRVGRGYLIANINVDDGTGLNHRHDWIDTVITEIRINNFRAEDGAIAPPSRQRITTGAGELDPMQLLGRLDVPEPRSWGELTGAFEPPPEGWK